MESLVRKLETRSIEARATAANFVLVKLSSPIQPWAAAFAAHKILVGTWGHVGPMASYIRITVNNDDESKRFLDTLDLILHQGIPGASQVKGVPGEWSDLGSEGMA
jgi:histidinol-phosphate/aromatic aminotransferase/cobyric acid decarboxylase-like protein